MRKRQRGKRTQFSAKCTQPQKSRPENGRTNAAVDASLSIFLVNEIAPHILNCPLCTAAAHGRTKHGPIY
jgi:hypothetical protein